MHKNGSGIADAYRLAAHEMRSIQGLPWEDLSPREDAPWLFTTGELRGLAGAKGGITIVDAYDGDPSTKRVTVALEWFHHRQGSRSVRLVMLRRRGGG